MSKYPVFILAGRDKERREIMKNMDPEEKYQIKALLPFLGKRVIDYVVEALYQSKMVEDVYIVGQNEKTLPFDNFPVKYIEIDYISDIKTKYNAILNYLERENKKLNYIIFCSSDCPAIRPELVDQFIKEVDSCENCDFIMSIVPNERVVELYGKSNRVVGKFTDAEVFPGEMYALSPRAIKVGTKEIEILSNRRRNRTFWGTASYIVKKAIKKPSTWFRILKLVFKIASLNDAKIIFEKVFEIKGKAVIIDDIGFGYDLDLEEDYEKLEKLVIQRSNEIKK